MPKKLFAAWIALCLLALPLTGLSQEDQGLFVKKVPGLSDDFLLGADISTLIAEENSGAAYYDENGRPGDLLAILKAHGLNSVRLRVWVDPFDAQGNSYGGGVCDINTAVLIGQRAAKQGMSVLIDFHYSDFWADPGKQMCPKAWQGLNIGDKAAALSEYTAESLQTLIAAGVPVCMVQIGNEINNGIAGETLWSNIGALLNAAASAVRSVDDSIKIAVHYANPENSSSYGRYATMLERYHVDYDVFASSYYPYWHGTLDNLKQVLSDIQTNYGKQVMLAETSWAYTLEDGDGWGNTIGEGTAADFRYRVTEQGQADCIRDCVAAMTEIGGVGFYYWEPAWLPVPGGSQAEREQKWETYGSGWASSYAKEYDPKDAGVYYGGSAWDNQALFDFSGHPLRSLSVFGLLKTGAVTQLRPDGVEKPSVSARIGEVVTLPDTVGVVLNNGESEQIAAVWDKSALQTILASGVGQYTVTGEVLYGGETLSVACAVQIRDLNYVENFGFEDEDLSMWTFTDVSGTTDELYVIDRSQDAAAGSKSLHFYSEKPIAFRAEQRITGVPKGTYRFSITLHGGDCTSADMEIYVIADGVTYTQKTGVSGWRKFSTPTIENIACESGEVTVGAYMKCDAKGWGNLDEFLLTPLETAKEAQ